MAWNRIEILKKIKPSSEERNRIKKFIDNLYKIAERHAKPFNAYPMFVGSIAKNTWLRGDHDIDLFLIFKARFPKEKLEDYGLKIGVSISEELGGKYILKYAEHPYVHILVSGYEIDVVPCYEIKEGEKIISAVDRSPLHYKYVKSKLTPSLCDEVRLLKYFCKVIGVYGSDVVTRGVSGYLCELLIINFGSFTKALNEISKWFFGEFIDIEGLSNKKEAIRKFRNEPLIVIDPVDKNRNVASSLSAENLWILINEAKKFVETKEFPKPKKQKAKPFLIQKLKKDRETYFFGVVFEKGEGEILDTIYPQLRKLQRRIHSYLEMEEFKVVRAFSFINQNCYLIFEVESKHLPKIKKNEGPIIFSKENVLRFLQKYPNAYIEGIRFYSDVKRRYQNVITAVKSFFRERKEEIPKDYQKRAFRILEEEELIERVEKDKALNIFLQNKYFSK